MNSRTSFILFRLFLGALILGLVGCAPKAEQPSFRTLRLSNRTEQELSFAITLNGYFAEACERGYNGPPRRLVGANTPAVAQPTWSSL